VKGIAETYLLIFLATFASSCNRQSANRETPTSSLEFLSSIDFHVESEKLRGRLPDQEGSYQNWKVYHDKLLDIAQRHGTVSDIPDEPPPDFYYSGDWFHKLSDGFAVNSQKALSSQSLKELREVVANHDDLAILNLGGGYEPPLEGLSILISSDRILVSCLGKDAQECIEFLSGLGINLQKAENSKSEDSQKTQ